MRTKNIYVTDLYRFGPWKVLVAGIMLVFLFFYASQSHAEDNATNLNKRLILSELMESMDMRAQLEQRIPSMVKSLLAIMKQSNNLDNMPPRGLEIIEQELTSHLLSKTSLVLEANMQLYAESFSAEELMQILTFYRSPAGQKTINLAPILQQKGALIGQQIYATPDPEFTALLNKRLRDEGLMKQ